MAYIGVETRPAMHYAALPLSVSYGNLPLRVSEAFEALGGYFRSHGIVPAGPSLVRYRTKHPERPFNIEVGWVVDRDSWIEAPYVLGTIPGGRYVTSRVDGPFGDVLQLERDMMNWAVAEAVELAVVHERTASVWDANIEFRPADMPDPLSSPDARAELCLLTK